MMAATAFAIAGGFAWGPLVDHIGPKRTLDIVLAQAKGEISESRKLMLARRVKEIRGKIQELNTRLENGDVIEIITSKNSWPSGDWLKFVVTPRAKRKLGYYALPLLWRDRDPAAFDRSVRALGAQRSEFVHLDDLDVAAEAEAHGGENAVLEIVLAAGGETLEQRGGEDVGGNTLVVGRGHVQAPELHQEAGGEREGGAQHQVVGAVAQGEGQEHPPVVPEPAVGR